MQILFVKHWATCRNCWQNVSEIYRILSAIPKYALSQVPSLSLSQALSPNRIANMKSAELDGQLNESTVLRRNQVAR